MVLTTKTDQCYLALGLMVVILLILYKLEYSRLGLIWKSIGMADNLALSLGSTSPPISSWRLPWGVSSLAWLAHSARTSCAFSFHRRLTS